MGVFTFVVGKLIYPVLFTTGATVFAFRLGNELPIAARRAGRSIGMGYNYFKVTLRVRHCWWVMRGIVFHSGVEAGERDSLSVQEDVTASARVHAGI